MDVYERFIAELTAKRYFNWRSFAVFAIMTSLALILEWASERI